MPGLILPLSNTQAKSLAGKPWIFQGQTYYFKAYDPAAPGQPPWRSGAEGKAFPLVNGSGQVAAYLKFFTTPSQVRLDRTRWLVAQQMHAWAPQLCAAPSAWVDSRQDGRPDGAEFDLTGCFATAAQGETWLELKYRLCENRAKFDKDLRWQCLRDLVAALAVLEKAGIVHGDLSPGNILVNVRPASGTPALAVIDFDAFVAQTGGGRLALTAGDGGTYGTEGYCPPDLVQKAQAGDRSVAPYSDRHSRDMLLLELLLTGPEFPAEAPPRDWPRDKLERRYRAFLSTVPADSTAAVQHLQPPAVFGLAEPQRPASVVLAKALALALPSPQVKAVPVAQPPPAPRPKPAPRPAPVPMPPSRPARRPARVLAGLALFLTLAVAGGWYVGVRLPEQRQAEAQGAPALAAVSPAPASLPSGQRWTNTLGMGFTGVPGAPAFSIWETRVQDYQAFATATGRSWPKPSFAQGPTHPAVNVSWDDAQAFCQWLTTKDRAEGKLSASQEYRLPTDAEWSVAVGLGNERGSSPKDKDNKIKDVYPWGTRWPPPQGAGNYHSNLRVDAFDNTSPAGSFPPNKFGLYDLGGNVWEWCSDEYSPSSRSRVLRGGSWRNDVQDFLLSSYRSSSTPGNRYADFGFRCVLVAGMSR
jgi:serine/threonine protein kinase